MDDTPEPARPANCAPAAVATPVARRPTTTLRIKSIAESGLARGIGIRLKLLLGFGLSSLAVGGITFLAVRDRVRTGFLEAAAGELVATRRAFLSLMDTQFVHLEAAGRLIADAPKLRAAVDTGDPATVQGEAGWCRTNGQADLLAVLDRGDRVLAFDGPAGHGAPPDGATQRSLATLARSALARGSQRGLLALERAVFLAAAVPIASSPEPPVGAVVIGFQIDERLALRLHAVAQAQVVFLVDGRLATSSCPAATWEEIRRQLGADIDPGVAGRTASGSADPAIEIRSGHQRQRHLHLAGRFQPFRDGPALTYVLLMDLAERDAAVARLESTMLAGGTAFLVIVMVLSGHIARRITRGIEQLVHSANQMAQGNFEAPMNLDGSDEVSYLAHAMCELRNAVSDHVRRLARINDSLRGKIEEILFNETLGAHYDQVEIIGRGGMGIVYRAFDTQRGHTVAIKVLSPLLAEQRSFVHRFLREAEILSRLQHPGLIRVYEAAQTKLPYCEMEYFPGQSLQDVVAKGAPLPWSRALPMADRILDALAHVHSCGIVHRDVKPSNILVGDGDEIRIIDFGLARDESLTHLTQTGEVMGTPDYIAPEQESSLDVDARADIFSSGLTIHFMLSGQAPRIRKSGYEPVSRQRPPGLPDPPPPAVDRVLSRAVALDPAARFASCGEFRQALAELGGARSTGSGP
jgi:HAMP domain-containing protein